MALLYSSEKILFRLGMQNEAGQRLRELHQENTLVILNTLFKQHKRWLYTWTSPTGQYQNQTDYILCNQRWRSSIELAKTRPGTDCDFVHEHACVLSQFFATLWTIVCQTPLPMGFSRQECWSGLPFPPPGDLSDSGIELSPALACEFFATSATWEALQSGNKSQFKCL